MRAIILVLVVLLVGCDDFGPRRYELVTASTGVYLLDTKTGRVWERDALGRENFKQVGFLMDSSPIVQKQLEAVEPELKKFARENFTLRPNSWKDFFQGWKAFLRGEGR